jgi:hypothetical protein
MGGPAGVGWPCFPGIPVAAERVPQEVGRLT